MARLFGRPQFHRVPRRIVIHGVAGPVETPAPGALERKPPPPIPREPHRRQVKPLPLLGVRPRAPLVSVAKMLMERHRKIMRFRMQGKPTPTVPVPVVVGAVPTLARSLQLALPVAVAARLRTVVRGRTEGATPFVPKQVTTLRPPAARVQRPPIVRGVAAVPAVGKTPIRPASPAAKVPRHQPRAPARIPGGLFVPGGQVFRVRPPLFIKPPPYFRMVVRFFVTVPPSPFAPTEVVTVGVWSAAVIFSAGDCLLVTVDGAAKTDPVIRININLTPQ